MSATIALVLDCADPRRLATFWSEALGYTTVGDAGSYVLLVPVASGRRWPVSERRRRANVRT